jgi:hypothetical protein
MAGSTRRLNLIGLTALLTTLACSGGSGSGDAGTAGGGGHAGGNGDAAAGADGAAGAGGDGAGGAAGGAGGGRGGSAGGGSCATDADCVFNVNAGCCGVCLAKTDPVPPTVACGAFCGSPPSCLCVGGHCREGSLTSGASCDVSGNGCGRNLLCCRLCSPVGAGCDSPRCATPITNGGLPMCPQPS